MQSTVGQDERPAVGDALGGKVSECCQKESDSIVREIRVCYNTLQMEVESGTGHHGGGIRRIKQCTAGGREACHLARNRLDRSVRAI